MIVTGCTAHVRDFKEDRPNVDDLQVGTKLGVRTLRCQPKTISASGLPISGTLPQLETEPYEECLFLSEEIAPLSLSTALPPT